MKLLCSWSGGKDSCFALMQMNQAPTVLLNALNEGGEISRSHGIPKKVLQAQAAAIGIPIAFISATWEAYTEKYIQQLRELSQEYELSDAVFGDIDLQPHRDWEEQVCTAAGISCNLPLWQQDRKELVYKMLDSGIKTMIVSCNDHLGMDFLGKIINQETIEALEAKGVDICGENGEFHTLVLECPLFKTPIDIELGEKRSNGTGYNFISVGLRKL